MRTFKHTLRGLALTGVVAACAVAPASAGAQASGPIDSFTFAPASPAAGAHSTTSLNVLLDREAPPELFGGITPTELAKTVSVDLPPGLLADPTGTPTCSQSDLEAANVSGCPDDTQVGLLTLDFTGYGDFGDPAQPPPPLVYPIFNMTRRGDQVARLGAPAVQGASAVISIEVRIREESDYGATATVRNIPSAISFWQAKVELWDAPRDPSHDAQRSSCQPSYANGTFTDGCTAPLPGPVRPFMVNSTRCDAQLTGGLGLEVYSQPGTFFQRAAAAYSGTDCAALPFTPALTVSPDSRVAGQPAGYAVDLGVPQTDGADERATAHVRDVSVTLPEGTAISPAVAQGLGACSDAQLGIGTRNAPACPESSKIGTATIDSPLVDSPLTGAVYIGNQQSNDPQSGQLYRLLLVAQGSGVNVKLRGSIRANPATGQLTASFDANPQLPFDSLALRFKGGSRAPLANPTTCGTKTTRSTITSWAGQRVSADSSYTIDQGCPTGRFIPIVRGGVASPVALRSSPFTLDVSRADEDQELGRIEADLPRGLLARLRDVPLCGAAQAAAGTCGEGSRVGSASVLAGAGANPLALGGKAYLAGPYRGAPFSLSVVVPAVAGPYNLGPVTVRAALFVDRRDAHVTVQSDPLPTIVAGVLLRLRNVSVTTDRRGFMLNPTSCARAAVKGTITSVGGTTAVRGVPFGLQSCGALRFGPKLALSLSGKGLTSDGDHPRLNADLRFSRKPGQANARTVAVTLPRSLALDPENARALCEPSAAAADRCPAASIIGRATAVTGLLRSPIAGPVYFVRGERRSSTGRVIRTLPKLYVPLKGRDGVTIDLNASSSVRSNRLVTTFTNVPDAPVERVRLAINGGKNGVLVVSNADLCSGRQLARAALTGQHGRTARSTVVMKTPCARRSARKK